MSREQYYINTLKPDYNILNIAGSSLSFNHSEVTKKLLSSSQLGIKRNTQVIVKIRSSETRLKQSVSSFNAIPVKVTHIETGKLTYFSSKSKAAEFF